MFTSVRVSKPDAKSVAVLFSSGDMPKKVSKATTAASKRDGFKFKAGELSESFGPAGHAIIVGTGKGTTIDWRNSANALGRYAAKNGIKNLKLAGDGLGAEQAATIGEVFGLLAWDPVLYRGKGGEKRGAKPVRLETADKELQSAMKRGLELASCTNLTRTLVATPPNIATPLYMAAQAEEVAKETGMKCTVMKVKKLEDENLVGMTTVGKASENPPCMIRLEYTPEGSDGKNPVVLLGKTVTYDTGGLSLKPRESMKGMKVDKAGGCAVLGAMKAIASVIKPDVPVVGLMVAAENCVSDEAYRPDDVITFRNGVSVEVTNTDAEGRLVLADGLCWACDVEKPKCIIDIATLTGGVVVALGDVYGGIFSNDDTLCATVQEAGESTDEMLWRLPLHERYKSLMKSQVADIVNSSAKRSAHPVQGAIFLEYFVKKGTAWAHIDMAGKGTVDKDTGAIVPGPTGFGVRVLTEAVGRLA